MFRNSDLLFFFPPPLAVNNKSHGRGTHILHNAQPSVGQQYSRLSVAEQP